MEQYIKKSDIIAEIEKRIKGLKDCHADTVAGYAGEISGLERLLSFLDTLEVKDVDEIIKNAEDHAYFAGSENTREKLINEACKWWEVELIFPSMTPDEIKWYKSKVRKFRNAMEDK